MGEQSGARIDQRTCCGIVMKRVSNGHPHRNGEQGKRIPTMPKLSMLREMDAAEARRLQLFGERIIADIIAFQHRQRRRREGRQGVSA